MIHTGTKTIETDRLILRRFAAEDAYDMYNNWACDDDVNRYMTSTSLSDVSQAQSVVERWAERYSNEQFYHWNITLKNDPCTKSAGFICVVALDNDAQKMEFGYCIGKKWWNKGYMTEAVNAAIDYLFDNVKPQRIEIQYDTDNPASGKVAEKCGMIYEGTLRKSLYNKGKLCDISVYSILSTDKRG